MNTTISKVKTHIKENRSIYIWSGITAVAAVAATAVGFKLMHQCKGSNTAIGDLSIAGDNNRLYYKHISVYGNPLGAPGKPVVDTLTGHRYETIKLAAIAMETGYDTFLKCLNNGAPVNGHTFVRLIEGE
jgi:hypothetical protein